LLKEQHPDIDEFFYHQEWAVCLPLKK